MRIAIFILALILPSTSFAGLLDIGGMADLAASCAKATKIGYLIDAKGTQEAAYYLGFKPSWKGVPWHQNFELGIGATSKTLKGSYELLVAPTFNLTHYASYIVTVPIQNPPDIWIGPYIRTPSWGSTWVIGKEIGGLISIGISSKPEVK